MKALKEFNIPFIGLKEGTHQFNYHIDNNFFKAFDYVEFNDSDIDVTVDFVKKTTLLEFNFSVKGTVKVPCDVTGELFNQHIEGSFPLIVKFGQEFNDDDEEALIVPHGTYQIDVAQYIYELAVLSVPLKRVHPSVVEGTMQSDVLEKLKELSYESDCIAEQDNTNIDPRWDKLKDLLTGKNT